MSSFAAACLTVFPLASKTSYGEEESGKGVDFLPAIGLVTGAMSALVDRGFRRLFSPLTASIVAARRCPQ